jgi:hypothetical protein
MENKLSVTKTKLLILCKEMIAVYCMNHLEPVTHCVDEVQNFVILPIHMLLMICVVLNIFPCVSFLTHSVCTFLPFQER